MPDDEGLQERLAEVLWMADAGTVSYSWQEVAERARGKWLLRAAAILPLVERYAARRAAEAWDDAYEAGIFAGANDPGLADELDREADDSDAPRHLIDAADRIRRALAADGTEPRPAHQEITRTPEAAARLREDLDKIQAAERAIWTEPRPAHRQDETEAGR